MSQTKLLNDLYKLYVKLSDQRSELPEKEV